MTASEAIFPTTEDAVGVRVDSGALLDRASAFIRSWSARDGQRSISQVLATWRLAERDLDRTTPGSDAWNDASERFLVARSEYRRLFEIAVLDAGPLRFLG